MELGRPQFPRRVFYSLSGDGKCVFGSLRRGKREEGVLVMLILLRFPNRFWDYGAEGSVAPQLRAWGCLRNRFLCSLFIPDRCGPCVSVSRRFWDAARLLLRHALFPLPVTPWLPGKFLLIP